MCAISKKSAVLAAAFVVLVGGAARASTLEVKVPFQFLVHGETMPAGRYLIDDDGSGVMTIRAMEHNVTRVFVMTTPADAHDPAGDTPAVTFTRGEKMWQLTGIWESVTEGRKVLE